MNYLICSGTPLTVHPEGELVGDPLADAVVRRARVDPGVGAVHGCQAQLGAGGGGGKQVAARVGRLGEQRLVENAVDREKILSWTTKACTFLKGLATVCLSAISQR